MSRYNTNLLIPVIVIIGMFGLSPGNTVAGGLEFPALGTVAVGRGTAFVAKADNQSAFFYNPAGLSKQRGPHLLLGGNLVYMRVDYQRAGTDDLKPIGDPDLGLVSMNPSLDYAYPADRQSFREVSLGKNIGALPMVVFNWGDAFRVKGLALAIGLVPPSSFGTPAYPANGPQRYAVRSGDSLTIFPGVGLSYAVNRYFQVGAVFLSGIAIIEQSQAIRPTFIGGDIVNYNEHLGGDAVMKVHCKDFFVPTGIIGLLSNPVDWLEVGASVRIPSYIEAKGRVSYTPAELDLPDGYIVDGHDRATIRNHFPWVVRAGLRYIHRYFDIEADFVWENWRSMQSFEIDMDALLNDGTADIAMPDTEVPKNFRDTYSVRLGGDVAVWPEHITVRLGGFYQSSAYPKNNETFNVDFPFGEQFGISGGMSIRTGPYMDVNIGYMHIFQTEVTVRNGVVQQQGLPFDTGEEKVNIGNRVNNGRYKVAIDLFGLSLEGHFPIIKKAKKNQTDGEQS